MQESVQEALNDFGAKIIEIITTMGEKAGEFFRQLEDLEKAARALVRCAAGVHGSVGARCLFAGSPRAGQKSGAERRALVFVHTHTHGRSGVGAGGELHPLASAGVLHTAAPRRDGSVVALPEGIALELSLKRLCRVPVHLM